MVYTILYSGISEIKLIYISSVKKTTKAEEF